MHNENSVYKAFLHLLSPFKEPTSQSSEQRCFSDYHFTSFNWTWLCNLHRKVLVGLLVLSAHLIRERERSKYIYINPLVLWLFNAGTKRIWQVLQTLLLLRRPPNWKPSQFSEGVHHPNQCSVFLWHTGNKEFDSIFN